ncbi:asparaginase domain-containing protein [Treponema phagedenis]|uniref:asparaginase domain-containing protein n=2 Tax=Treponema phagedenis TaxID=162 RepID=UPI00208DB5A4|nr:asparaginase domain-containing protein [Treponema phagedenis]
MYQSFVFLETRVLMPSDKKAFCDCKTGNSPETCSVCRKEISSALPIPKDSALCHAYQLAKMLHCTLLFEVPYERLIGTPETPKKYSLFGASLKIAENGYVNIEFHRHKKRIAITEIRFEEDAGKLIHGAEKTFMDYTCAGMPSIRIRTGENIELGEEAEVFLTDLKQKLEYIGIGSEGSGNRIRCNAYAAVTEYRNKPKHYVKLRNLNSFNFVRNAINEDLRRQEALLKNGKEVSSESRLWNERLGYTESYKTREFIDSVQAVVLKNIPPYLTSDKCKQKLLTMQIEDPNERELRFVRQYRLPLKTAKTLCTDKNWADFFEETVNRMIKPYVAAQWFLTEIPGSLKKMSLSLEKSSLTAEKFAQVLHLFEKKHINRNIAKKLLQELLISDAEPEIVLTQKQWQQVTDVKILKELIRTAIIANPSEAERLKEGDMRPLEFLTGILMKETRGLADPQTIKQLIKEELNINIVYVLSMGGTISALIKKGEIEAGHAEILSTLVKNQQNEKYIRFETVSSEALLSEEIEPADWAKLITAICEKIASGTANGIVLAHGTDTLVYTAPLIYWLFADSPVPIVLTASNTPPNHHAENIAENEAGKNLNAAINLAHEKTEGVYVVFNGEILSPLNLKFLKSSGNSFVNRNMNTPIFTGEGLLTDYSEMEAAVFESLLSAAAENMLLIKMYPGIRKDFLLKCLNEGISHFFLELYGRGTANMRNSLYSLNEFFRRGGKQQCRFYCTSQQEEPVDFSRYVSSHSVWKEGAVPMGNLTTETAIALYYAASIVCDTEAELDEIMETYSKIDTN